jgi:hypothetical protein
MYVIASEMLAVSAPCISIVAPAICRVTEFCNVQLRSKAARSQHAVEGKVQTASDSANFMSACHERLYRNPLPQSLLRKLALLSLMSL